ncbi:cytidine deaminase [soil metagenome]
MNDDDLLALAREARDRAFAPYSGFPVGAALETTTGEIFVGCNVENASYGLTVCAERNAVATAVAQGYREFRKLALSTMASEPTPPCGACRQVLVEFGAGLEIVSEADGRRSQWQLDVLLPARFQFAPPHGGADEA